MPKFPPTDIIMPPFLTVGVFQDYGTLSTQASSVRSTDLATTRYVNFNGTFSLTETSAQSIIPKAVTASALYIVISQNTNDVATVFTLRDDVANTSITISVGAGLTGTFSDTSHTAAIAAGSLCDISIYTSTQQPSCYCDKIGVGF